MKIAIVGAGFTGLTAAYKLSQKGYEVTVFEKEKELGGLASAFKLPEWQWPLEKHYHHWFQNDFSVINLIKELKLTKKLFFPKSLTSIYYQNKIYPFNTPFQILSFTPLSFFDRLRLGIVSLYFKLLPPPIAQTLEKATAYEFIPKYFGQSCFEIVWKPLLEGKFSSYAKIVNMAWFWARIKKRTPKLGYIEGGYQTIIDALAKKIKEKKGKILLGRTFNKKLSSSFDKVIVTAPSTAFINMFPQLPKSYLQNIKSIPHLHALNLLLLSKDKFLDRTYWLNITDRNFPFIGVIEHTNMINPKYYAGNHLIWVANYLPENHSYLKMSAQQLFNVYLPYLQRINPAFNFKSGIKNLKLFYGPFAQPVFPINYSKIKPEFKTPLPNVYLANMDMVYPWDRGTNYAVELGAQVAKKIC